MEEKKERIKILEEIILELYEIIEDFPLNIGDSHDKAIELFNRAGLSVEQGE